MKNIEEVLRNLDKSQLQVLAQVFAELEVSYKIAWDSFNQATGWGLEEATSGAWEIVKPMCQEILKETK